MRLLALLLAVVASYGCLLGGAADAQQVHPGKKGAELVTLLRADFKPTHLLGYREARQRMFTQIDNVDGKVRLIYTGQEFATTVIPDEDFVNTEHTWPQSKFGPGNSGLRSDLHNLFPSYNKVNGDRGNKPFGDIPDDQTAKWWITPDFVRTIPAVNRDGFSESTRLCLKTVNYLEVARRR